MKTSALMPTLPRVLNFVLVVVFCLNLSSLALAHMPELGQGKAATLAPLVREVMPSIVNISVHGRVKEDNPLYREPLSRVLRYAKGA